MFDDEESIPTWDRLPLDVTSALSVVLDSNGMPSHALALYARWWQLETWLRDLAYVEIRSRDGLNWNNAIGSQAEIRQQRDDEYEYMASPDWENPLAYLDASRLLGLIEENWELFSTSLPGRESWAGRRAELLSIRNRIGHLRRPHRDDLRKIEQTLRDLERGAFRAITSYNRWLEPAGVSKDDPIFSAFRRDDLPGAKGLIAHAERQYNMGVRLSYTVRPWANFLAETDQPSGSSGIVWSVGFYPTLGNFDLVRLWKDLSPLTRQVVMHVLTDSPGHLNMTFPAVDDSDLIAVAIGDALESAMHYCRSGPEDSFESQTVRRLRTMDFRVQLVTPWAFVDESMTPISFFGA
ncbi:hypothetical protein [Actinosynnema sp. NPDC023587]|uniref:hypothetical protein n=1 Tax=Actinosynnema sp. NPDC023587 TaxID=3154695 RepID=UPI0033FC67F7